MKIGDKVIIRTVTYHYTGLVEAVSPEEVRLKDAAWVADSGRWTAALESGNLLEVEPYPDGVTIMVAAIVDYSPWGHPLPVEVL